jgi:hypothetical protein
MYLDAVLVVSGKGLDSQLKLASGQTKIGELLFLDEYGSGWSVEVL